MSFPRRVPAPAKLHSSQLRAPEVSRRPQPTDASEGVGTFRQTRLGFEEFSRSLGARRRDRTWQSGLPDFAMRVSRDLRTGASIDQALIDAITNTNAPAYVLEAPVVYGLASRSARRSNAGSKLHSRSPSDCL